MIEFRVFGGVDLRGPDGEELAAVLRQPKRLALLAYLAVTAHRGFQSRDTLLGLFWPDLDEKRARNALSQALHGLRDALGKDAIVTRGTEVGIDTSRVRCDALVFVETVEADRLAEALEVYRGELLPGFHLEGANEFERWLQLERRRLRQRASATAIALSDREQAQGDDTSAVRWARKALQISPDNEGALRQVVGVLDRSGDRGAAIRAYEQFASHLKAEYDLEPSPETQAFVQAIRDRDTAHPSATPEQPAPIVTVEPVEHRHPVWRVVLVLALLFGFAGLYVIVRDRGGMLNPPSVVAESPSAIAVLPFTVHGQDLQVWHEGMVDLLSTGLDGAAGLRTINARTIMTRWDEQVGGGRVVDLTTVLGVARATNATYALVGSAVLIDSQVRFATYIYDVHSGEQLGRARVEGSSDRVLMLVDGLAVEILRVILQRGEQDLPDINLANLTTANPQALRAYLEGEAKLRDFELPAALEALKRAVEADSTFALAHHRLAHVYGWDWTLDAALQTYHFERAVEFADRLPRRKAVLIQAALALVQGTTDGIEPLRRSVETDPDDAEAWYQLAETYLHVGGAMATAEETARAFERAVEVDPLSAQYLFHYLDFVFWFGEGANAERVLEMYRQAGPSAPRVSGGQLALELAFGDPATEEELIDRVRNEDEHLISTIVWLLYHPRYAAFSAAWRELYQRGSDVDKARAARFLYVINALWHGRLQEGLPFLDDDAGQLLQPDPNAPPDYPLEDEPGIVGRLGSYPFWALVTDSPIPNEALELIAIDSLANNPTVFYSGVIAADLGRWTEHVKAVEELEWRQDRAVAAADSGATVELAGRVGALRGYGLWRRQQLTEALPFLEDPRALNLWLVRWWLGQLYIELERFRDAEAVYRSYSYYNALSVEPLAQNQLGKIYEALEEYDKARQSYEYFVEYWRDADPELQPIVEEARRALDRLEGR